MLCQICPARRSGSNTPKAPLRDARVMVKGFNTLCICCQISRGVNTLNPNTNPNLIPDRNPNPNANPNPNTNANPNSSLVGLVNR